MGQKFITPVSMEYKKELLDYDLKSELITYGYDISSNIPLHTYPIFSSWFGKAFETTVGMAKKYTYFIDHYNPSLFLALAAMTEGKDIGLGEYMLCIDDDIAPDKWEREKGELVKCLEYSDKCENKRGSFGPGYSRSHWRKATKEELIEHFTKKIYTIDDLKNGKCAVINDGTVEELNKVLKLAFDDHTGCTGVYEFYWGTPNKYIDYDRGHEDELSLPTQSVKDFIKQMDKQDKNTIECDEGFMYDCEFHPTGTIEISKDILTEPAEWKPKWGEEVQVSNDGGYTWKLRYFVGMNPTNTFSTYVVVDNCGCVEIYHLCRKPKELSMLEAKQILSKHFNCSPDQIEIV